MTNRYEIHTWTLSDGWVNCWTTTDQDGQEHPESFPTIESALAELADAQHQAAAENKPAEHYKIYDTTTGKYLYLVPLTDTNNQ